MELEESFFPFRESCPQEGCHSAKQQMPPHHFIPSVLEHRVPGLNFENDQYYLTKDLPINAAPHNLLRFEPASLQKELPDGGGSSSSSQESLESKKMTGPDEIRGSEATSNKFIVI